MIEVRSPWVRSAIGVLIVIAIAAAPYFVGRCVAGHLLPQLLGLWPLVWLGGVVAIFLSFYALIAAVALIVGLIDLGICVGEWLFEKGD